MPLLETADSLMLSDPDAARQMLLSVEQGTDLRMNRSERAYYLLLMAEADYLCGQPLFRDTAVREAVRFFRSGGQQGLYARALIMHGAVYREVSDTLSSLVSCWDSLPADDVSGRREVAGLLRSIVENTCCLMPAGTRQLWTVPAEMQGWSSPYRPVCPLPAGLPPMQRNRQGTMLLRE